MWYNGIIMKCAVITPIGRGHTKLYEECKKSIEAAPVNSSGPFDEIVIIPVADAGLHP